MYNKLKKIAVDSALEKIAAGQQMHMSGGGNAAATTQAPSWLANADKARASSAARRAAPAPSAAAPAPVQKPQQMYMSGGGNTNATYEQPKWKQDADAARAASAQRSAAKAGPSKPISKDLVPGKVATKSDAVTAPGGSASQNNNTAVAKSTPATKQVQWTPEMTKAFRAREASAKGSQEWQTQQAIINKGYGFSASKVKPAATQQAAPAPALQMPKTDFAQKGRAVAPTREQYENAPAAAPAPVVGAPVAAPKKSLWNKTAQA